jgi:hypothetical protein
MARHRFSQRLTNLLHNEPSRRFPEVGTGPADLFQHVEFILKFGSSGKGGTNLAE